MFRRLFAATAAVALTPLAAVALAASALDSGPRDRVLIERG